MSIFYIEEAFKFYVVSSSAVAWPIRLGAAASRLECGQGLGLNLDVAIFVLFAHFFLFSFVFLFIFFPFCLFPFILTTDPFTASRDFCDNIFLVYVVTGVLARSRGAVCRYPPPHVFWKIVPRSRHFSIVLGTFSNLEHYFTFPALLSTFLTFEHKLSIFSLFGQHFKTELINFTSSAWKFWRAAAAESPFRVSACSVV